MADRSNANTPTPPAPAQQPIQDIQSLVAAMQAMAQENQRLLQSTINDLRHQMTSEMQALRKEVEDRHEYLDDRINRSRAAEQELRGAQDGKLPKGHVQPLPQGMKMPELKRIEAKSERALRQWFRQLDAYLRAYQMAGDDSRAVFFASQHFDGSLETWWQGRVEETDDSVSAGFGSVQELADAVYRQFSGRDMQDVARDKLDRVRQTGGVRAYAQLIRDNLVYLPHRSEGDNIHTFKRGLKTSIAQALALRKPSSLAEAIEMALAVEAAQSTRQAVGDKRAHMNVDLNALDGNVSDETDCPSEDGQSDDGGEDCDDDEAEDATINNIASKPFKESAIKAKWRKEGRCLKCGKKGHFSRDCPDRKAQSGDK